MRGEDGSPARQSPFLPKQGTLQSQQICVDAPRQSGTNGGKIDDGGGDACRSSNNIGSKDRQIKARVREPDAMENLQTPTKPRQFQVKMWRNGKQVSG